MPRWTNSPETDLSRPTWGYWIAQAATWSIWFTTWLFYWIGKKPITFKLICVGLTLTATFFALSHVFRSVIHRRGWLKLRVPQLGWRVLVSCLVLAALVQVIVDPIYVYLFRVTSWTEELSRQTIILYTFDGTITFISGPCFTSPSAMCVSYAPVRSSAGDLNQRSRLPNFVRSNRKSIPISYSIV